MTETRGSIMIWTLLLGVSLATVFFFFSQRLNSNAEAQRETIQYQNARLFFESYVAYVQSLDETDLASLRGPIDFQGITGTLTNEAEEVTGLLDAGQSVTYELSGDATMQAKIEWDACDDEDDVEILEVTPYDGSAETNCAPGFDYDNYALSQTGASSFELTATGAPVGYRIIPMNPATTLYDKEWKLDLSYTVGFRKKLTKSVIF